MKRYKQILVKIVMFEKGRRVGHFEGNFKGKPIVHQTLLASEN